MTKELLTMLISQFIFDKTGFGPSQNLCEEFIDKVENQAISMNVSLDYHD